MDKFYPCIPAETYVYEPANCTYPAACTMLIL